MKMGNRRLKALDAHGVKSLSKPQITEAPANRQERRALAKYKRKQGKKQ